ncbi:MAG: DUF3644 domain-containing protein [bacterium]
MIVVMDGAVKMELKNQLIDKSIEAFLMSLEIYNKPTISYRLEGCVFFLCNSWELLLKAKLIEDNVNIYYDNKKYRSITFNETVSKLFTNKSDPLRVNLETIASFRNQATHLIVPEMELIYLPLLASCVKNYSIKIEEYFGVKISDYLKTDFLAIFSSNNTTNINLDKYDTLIQSFFSDKAEEINNLHQVNQNDKFALGVNVTFSRVSNAQNADFTFYASNNPKNKNITYVDRQLDPNNTHTLSCRNLVNRIDILLKKDSIKFNYVTNNKSNNIFTTYCFDLIKRHYKIEDNCDYCYTFKNGNSTIKKYSEKLITYIISLILDNPNIIYDLKEKN